MDTRFQAYGMAFAIYRLFLQRRQQFFPQLLAAMGRMNKHPFHLANPLFTEHDGPTADGPVLPIADNERDDRRRR